MDDSMERIIPDQMADDRFSGVETLELHLARYRFAAQNLRPGRVLDIACGVGYGMDLVLREASDRVSEICGVDIDEGAIRYARSRYADPKATFIEEDSLKFSDGRGFDTIISLETIEHVGDPAALVSHIVDLLKPGGVLICSAPITPSMDVNPYHLCDFTEASFCGMFTGHDLIESARMRQVQPYGLRAVLARTETRLDSMRKGLMVYYIRHPAIALRRTIAMLRYGFNNHYLTIAWRKPGA